MTIAEISTLVTSAAACLAAGAAAYQAYRTHIAVNSRMDAFLKEMEEKFKAQGKAEEKSDQAGREAQK